MTYLLHLEIYSFDSPIIFRDLQFWLTYHV